MSLETISPSRRITMPLGFLIAIVSVIISMSVAWGGYKTAYEDKSRDLNELRENVKLLNASMGSLNVTVGRLDQELKDLTQRTYVAPTH